MVILKKIDEVRAQVKEWKKQGLTVGLVPTMGYLHEGHQSLIKKSVEQNDRTVVSVFVNPIQFGPNEDLESYPRDLEADAKLCESTGADIIFNPEPEEMYADGFVSFINMTGLPNALCGLTRPIHFKGVCTVVGKLFNIVTPDRAYFGQKDAQQLAMARGPAQQAAQHIAAALILRDNAVADHKDGGADVVGDHTDGNILFLILLVGDAGDLADLLHDVLDGIDLKEVIDALHDAGQALQAHAGIDVLVLQGGVMTLAVGIELGEYQVPELNIAVAVTADMAIGTAAALFGPAVKVDLGAGAAGAGADLPEVILFAQTDHVVGGDAAALGPDIIGLVIILVNRDIELIDGQLQLLGDELPGPAGSVLLEVIAEGEVAQHLEVGAVAGGLAYIFDIRGTDALLAAGGAEAAVRQELLPGEVFLEGGHAGIDEQEAGLILRHQRRRGQAGVPLTDKEFEEGFAQFIESCPFHSGLIPFFW